jgi:hypothetical protein
MTPISCEAKGSFTLIDMNPADVLTNNLGGIGGSVDTDKGLPREMHFRSIAHDTTGELDLKIVNETEYRAWNKAINGMTQKEDGNCTPTPFA